MIMKSMKTSIFAILLLLCGIIMVSPSCKKESDSNDQSSSKINIPPISIIDISKESNWDYWVIGKKDYYFIRASSTKPEAVLFHSYADDEEYSIFFKSSGLPDKVVANNYIFIFDNFDGKKVDIGVLYPSGEIEIIREVESGINWDEILLKNSQGTEAWSDVIRWTGRAVGGIPCALSVAATLSTSGIAWPLAAWTCGNYLLGLSSSIATDYGVNNGFTEFVNTYSMASTSLSCGSGEAISCLSGITSSAFEDWADDLEEIEERDSEIQVVVSALEYGYGDVQVTLTWDNTSDLDLWVTDPYGEKIYWYHPYSASGGQLDVDDVNGYGPENIFWPTGAAPNGTYLVQVDYYSGSGTALYTVLIQAFGGINQYQGSLQPYQTIDIATFSHGGKGLSINPLMNVNENQSVKIPK